MNAFLKTFFALVVTASFFLVGCSTKENPSTPPPDTGTTLTTHVVTSSLAPDVNNPAIESVWSSAEEMRVTVSPMGKNFSGDPSPFSVSLKAIRTDQDIYFLAEYDDATQDMLRQPVKFNGGNFSDENNWSWEKETYDDGFSFLFEIAPGVSGAKTFGANGCTMLCHETKTVQFDPGMFSESAGRYDLWYWNAGRSNGCGLADDKACLGSPGFGIIVDEPNKDNYLFNVISYSPGYLPFYIAGMMNSGLDKNYFIAESDYQLFSSTLSNNPASGSPWKAGDRVPGYYLKTISPNNPSGYYDVKSMGYYSGGKWHIKFKRKLNTNDSELDVTFAPGNEYGFSFAAHNHNKPGNHYGMAEKKFTLKL